MLNKFRQRIQQVPLLCDGAMGTMLHSQGHASGQAFESLNLTDPAAVAQVHRSYIDAGADMIQTNTFGANRIKLAKYGLEDRVAEINTAAVELARRVIQASFKDVLLAGSVGPAGRYLAPLGRLQPDEAYDLFHEQIAALVAAGVDVLLFETFSNLRTIQQAIAAARDIDPDMPIIAQMTFGTDGRTPLGDSPAQVGEVLGSLHVDVIGANCSVGPALVLRNVQALVPHLPDGVYLSAQPNAGLPHQAGNRLMYPANPDYFADYARQFLAAGVRLLGGCCGTTAEHIAHMRAALDTPVELRPVSVRRAIARDDDTYYPADPLEPTGMAHRLAGGEFVISVEIHPPRGASVARVLAAAQSLKEAGANVVNVADSPVARMCMSPWAVCHAVQTQIGLETVLNFPTRGRNLLRIQGDLLAAHALDIRNLFVVMGDPTSIGDYPDAFNNHDIVTTGLVQLVKQNFNTGVDYAGKKISEPTNFLVGCALNLGTDNLMKEAKLLKKKLDCGADFVMTQPIYEAHVLDEFVQAYEAEYEKLTIPIILSIMPLQNERNAEFLHNEVPGVFIPDALRQRMAAAGEDGPQEGLAIARDLILALRDRVQGVYIMPQFQRYHLAAELIESIQPEPVFAF